MPLKRMYANIGKLVASSLDMRDIIAGIMIEVEIFFQPEHYSIMRYDDISQELYFVSIQGTEKNLVNAIRLKLGEGVAGIVARDRTPLFVADAKEDPRFTPKVDAATGFATRSILAVPITWQNGLYGVIELVNRFDGRSYNEEDLMVLESIADFAGIAFANALMFRELKIYSRIDPLTGLYNRLKLEEVKQEYLEIAETHSRGGRRREDEMITLIALFVDLNDFKGINDRLGHHAGDDALRRLAQAMRQSLRRSDRVFRVGGDEFLILVECRGKENADASAKRVQAVLEALQVKAQDGALLTYSIGVSLGDASQIDELIRSADEKMYKVKKGL